MKKIIILFILAVFAFSSEVVLQTNKGDITLLLFPKIAPKATENFIKLSKKGYYDGVIFHRVIKNFMIQSGDPTGTGMGGESIWNKDFEDEFSPNVVFNKAGILAMANTGRRNTNSSQFFITVAPTPWLNGRHTIFGKVIKGYDIINQIQNVKTKNDKPIKDIVILKTIIK